MLQKYVLEVLQDNQVIKTYKKHNWDGPYKAPEGKT
jgi:hypothetical protein